MRGDDAMSEWFPRGTQVGHDEPLLQQADVWNAAGTDAAAFQGSSSYLTPTIQQLPSQVYFAVPASTGVEAYPFYQGSTPVADRNEAAAAPVAGGYCPDTWLGMNSGPMYTASSTAEYESVASMPPTMSSAKNNNIMQPPWGSRWDPTAGLVGVENAVPVSSMASPTATSQGAGADSGPTNTATTSAARKCKRAVRARGGTSASSPSASAVSPAPPARAHGFPADQASSQGGPRSSSITPRPSVVHHSPSLNRAPDSASPTLYHQASPPCPPPATYCLAAAAAGQPPHEAIPASSLAATPSIELELPTGTELKKQDLRRRNRKVATRCRAKSKDEETCLRDNAWEDLRSVGPPSEDEDEDEEDGGGGGGEVVKQASL
ncbi:hypothetical protein GGTG_09143 [Gaeumannomyces tritici R3-111a-1]|uniref:BZIP domain-containing protein n=1 Tax=Gaeumannomyces tritici (strain R3-111a-1) TaxID=644352 RepID=J3P6K2_GAET3|nr:hypothetical protein GGTG_09143 [Gaeumannomyces tritici R3-111a-1]EJT72277.1 hypothetical protein GGTG_09143 [Gaeumannomyces tritici R3-111a-1]